MRLLVTGPTGKVGQHFIDRFLDDTAWDKATVRAFCHRRTLADRARLESVKGSISDRTSVAAAMKDVTHVLHLATSKETPDDVMDVAVKGLFWLLEEARTSETFKQFILIGGDAAVGHFFHAHGIPLTERQRHAAYPGCYALSKVLEEAMLEQYYIQYGLSGCCLRAPWIMEKDDFKYTLSFGEDVFGGPIWSEMVDPAKVAQYRQSGTVPLLRDADDRPLRRNFVHVDDLASAILCALDNPAAHQQLFNVCMDEPVDYAKVARHLKATRGRPSVDIPSQFKSNWMDNNKAKFLLNWRPRYDLERLIEEAFEYQRSPDDPRKVWYPG